MLVAKNSQGNYILQCNSLVYTSLLAAIWANPDAQVPDEVVINESDYWGCECLEHYIHKRTVRHCPDCGVREIHGYDSEFEEIIVKENHYVGTD